MKKQPNYLRATGVGLILGVIVPLCLAGFDGLVMHYSDGVTITNAYTAAIQSATNYATLAPTNTSGLQNIPVAAMTNGLVGLPNGATNAVSIGNASSNGLTFASSGRAVTITVGFTNISFTNDGVSGAMGIGTTTPATAIAINASINSSSTAVGVTATNTHANGKALFTAVNSGGKTAGIGMFGSGFAVANLANTGGVSSDTGLYIFSDGAVDTTGSDPIMFSPGGYSHEKARITSGGNLGIGTTTPVSLFTVNGASSFSNTVTVSGSAVITNIVTANGGFVTGVSNGLAGVSITFPGTGATWTNQTGYNIVLYIDNTAVTGTAIKQNGTTIFSGLSADVTLILKTNDFFSETYSVGTPAGVWFPR